MGRSSLDRRSFMRFCSASGLAGTLFPGVLWAKIQERQEVTAEMVADAEKLAGLDFTPGEREAMLEGLEENLEAFEALRKPSTQCKVLVQP